MPLIENSNYTQPHLMFNGHLQTIFPAIFRNQNGLRFDRERINTPDGDFLDLDWMKMGREKLVIISHGLEGNSRRAYMKGMAKVFFENGYDVLNWNFRGCSETMNKGPLFYHSGATYDLNTVVSHAAKCYQELFLVGFSLGGNLTLKYMGESCWLHHAKIKKAVGISVPLDLGSSCDLLSEKSNKLYTYNFLKSLKQKIRKKAYLFPEKIDLEKLTEVHSIRDFDEYFTAPIHGFESAEDYYQKNSALHFLSGIKVPTLILNALNDPFLSKACYPKKLGEASSNIYMEFPAQGGHVGFSPRFRKDRYWSEKRALEFIQMEKYC